MGNINFMKKRKTTFLCDVCGKELPVKYRHKGNTCAACFESQKVGKPIGSVPPTPAKAPTQPAQEKTVLPGSTPRGDVVTLKALPENQKTTFLCDVCGKELPVKYRHKGNTCVTCFESKTVHTVQPAPQPQSATPFERDEVKANTETEKPSANPMFVIRDGTLDKYTGSGGDVVIPSSVTRIGEFAFSYCSGLTSITIPDSVTSIGEYAFRDCSGLTCIIIPNSVTSIGKYVFSRCSGLSSITIPDSVTSIGESVFFGCSGLTCIYVASGNSKYHCNGNCLIETERKMLVAGCSTSVIPTDGSVTSIEQSAFFDCSGLTCISIPDSVTSIGEYAFRDCSSLTSITIPNSVTSIGNSAFSGCSGLTSITIPDSVTSIGNSAFSDCSSLTCISIPDSVTSIDTAAFLRCSSLTSITIPNSVTSIGNWAFSDCSSLTSISIPDSVTGIADGMFFGCSSLTSVTIPKSVTYIDPNAFSNCSSLKTLPTVQPICIDDAVKILRDEIIAQITKYPSVNYQLDSLLWGAAASCFPGSYKWDAALFQLDLIRKKLGARVSVYPDRCGYAPESFISLSASEFHQIAKKYHMSSVLQAFQSDEDWGMLFDESLDAAIASARSTLQKQEEERQNAERKKYAIKIPTELATLSPKMNVMTIQIELDQHYGNSGIQLINKNGKYHIRAGCHSRTLSAAEAVWFEKQLENTINNPDDATWQSLAGSDHMSVEIKRKGYNDILLYSVTPRKKYTDFKNALEKLAQYGSQ